MNNSNEQTTRNLTNTSNEDVKKNIDDSVIFGDDCWKLIAKFSSETLGIMKSTKAMDIGNGCVIQVTTQQQNPDGTYSLSEAVTYVPDVTILDLNKDGQTIARYIKPINEAAEILATAKDEEDEF